MARVIVTGASRGLGLAIATRLAHAGTSVIAVARSSSEALDAAVAKSGGSIAFAPFDLAQTAGLGPFLRGLAKQHGGIAGLVNNAGIGTSGVLAGMREADIERLVRLNTLSPIILTKHAVRAMMTSADSSKCAIVNVASVVATTGFTGLSVYSATKASLIGFTRSLARELGPLGIRVNAVAPGFIETQMTESLTGDQRHQVARRSALQRLASADDVAETVAFLMSDAARSITGTVVTVDAGGTA